jgi:protein-S-isoprenylcysteine O-methyltransferase Ste14
MTAYLIIFVSLTCFAVFHGATAREGVKTFIRGKTGLSYGAYAALRAIVSLSMLVVSVIVLFGEAGATAILFTPLHGIPAILPGMFAFWIAGMALGQVAKSRRLPQFFGFQEYPKLFIFTGAYNLCRHPMYTAWLVASWGLLVSQPHLLTVFYNILLTSFVVYTALQEERQMIALFGDKYRTYQRQIPFLLPYGFLKPQIRREGAPRF